MFAVEFTNQRGGKRSLRPSCEGLERRTVLSGTGLATAGRAIVVDQALFARQVHTSRSQAPALGTISGQVASAAGRGLRRIQVQLIDADGALVRSVSTNNRGRYSFRIRENGPYVVRAVVPRRFVQTTPTFANRAPDGAFLPGFGNSSWNDFTGNSDPTQGPVGPRFWSTITTVGNDPFQTPINLTGPTTDLSRFVSVHYANAVPSKLVNNGYQIQVQFPSASSTDTITVGGVPYTLLQFHFHDPSEHTVNNQSYPMEAHFENASAAGGLTALTVFLQLGAHNAALDPILNAATSKLTTPNSSTTIPDAINFAGLLPTNTQGWFYEGSLTTPPLSLPVNFFIYATPITLDFAQLSAYEKVAGGSGFLPNARPIQPTDGRQLNEIDFDVDFKNQSIGGLNFVFSPAGTGIASRTRRT